MIGVYTVLFGPYDDVPPADYGGVLFTDQNIQPDGWEVRRVVAPFEDANLSSRYYFCQSCRVMPEYDITVEHGADVQLHVSPEQLVRDCLPDGYDLASYAHPHRSNVYDEAQTCIRLKKCETGPVEKQMARYRKEGFSGQDLSACIVLIRRNCEWVRQLEDLWWSEVQRGSRRNQLSFDYCRWKLNIPIARIPGSPYDRRAGLISVQRHRQQVRYG